MKTHAPPVPASVQPASLRPSAGPPPSRRRLTGALVCGLVALLAALAAMWSVTKVSDRVPVVAVKADVQVGQQLTADDLTVAQIADDPALKPVPGDDRKALVGQYAAVDLTAGSLLTEGQVAKSNPLADGKQLVGVQAKRGQLPLQALTPGDEVLVVATPSEGAVDGAEEREEQAPIAATVVEVGPADASGAVVVNLAAEATDAPVLAAQAATGNIAIVLEARG